MKVKIEMLASKPVEGLMRQKGWQGEVTSGVAVGLMKSGWARRVEVKPTPAPKHADDSADKASK